MLRAAPKPIRIRDDAARAYVRGLRCLLADEDPCTCGPYIDVVSRRIVIEAAHIKSWGSGGDDPENLVPLCEGHHRKRWDSLHQVGRHSFARLHVVALGARSLQQIARQVWADYLLQRGPEQSREAAD